MHTLQRIYSILVFILFLSPDAFAQPDFTASATEGCTPFKVKFAIDPATVDMDTIEQIDWNFGNGDSLSSLNPDTVVYTSRGVYSVSMVINNFRASQVVKADIITVHYTVNAAFRYEEYSSQYNYRFIPLDEITDPDGLYFYAWHYENTSGTDIRLNNHVIDITNQENAIDSVTLDTGIYNVFLMIDDTFGCFSRADQSVLVTSEIQIPNVFVPGIERFFIIDPKDINIVLSFEVYNRYGLPVFNQMAPIINWDGETNSGEELSTGVYFYVLKSIAGDQTSRYLQNGFIHLYR
jgi:PKD repeat protein